MRLEKIESNIEMYYFTDFYDYIDCGEFYLLTHLRNGENLMMTLNQNTVLEDIQEKHGVRISYSKFCKTTFRLYLGERGRFDSENLDEVLGWAEIGTPHEEYIYSRTLKALVTGEGLEDPELPELAVRWPNKNGGRGESWYWLMEDYEE